MEAYMESSGSKELLKTLVAELVTHQPEKPVQFMMELLAKYQRIETTPIYSIDVDSKDISSLCSGRRNAVSSEPAKEVESAYTPKLKIKDEEVNARLHSALQKNMLSSHLDEHERKEINAAMYAKSFCIGERIIVQGDENGDKFYVVEEGKCDIFVSRNDKQELVQRVGIAGSFGELALIYNTPRAATVIAATDVKLWCINRMTYRKILMDSTIKKRTLYQGFLSKVPILSSLHEYERLTIADALAPVSFGKGATVVRQGAAGDTFYIITKGRAMVMQIDLKNGEEKKIGELGPSDYFGEVALLTNRPRQATVIGIEELQCIKLNRDRFIRVIGPCEAILRRNMKSYNKYMSKSI